MNVLKITIKVDQYTLKVLGNIGFHVPNQPFGPIIIKLVFRALEVA